MPLVPPWYPLGVPLVPPWYALGVPLVPPWYALGVPLHASKQNNVTNTQTTKVSLAVIMLLYELLCCTTQKQPSCEKMVWS